MIDRRVPPIPRYEPTAVRWRTKSNKKKSLLGLNDRPKRPKPDSFVRCVCVLEGTVDFTFCGVQSPDLRLFNNWTTRSGNRHWSPVPFNTDKSDTERDGLDSGGACHLLVLVPLGFNSNLVNFSAIGTVIVSARVSRNCPNFYRIVI